MKLTLVFLETGAASHLRRLHSCPKIARCQIRYLQMADEFRLHLDANCFELTLRQKAQKIGSIPYLSTVEEFLAFVLMEWNCIFELLHWKRSEVHSCTLYEENKGRTYEAVECQSVRGPRLVNNDCGTHRPPAFPNSADL